MLDKHVIRHIDFIGKREFMDIPLFEEGLHLMMPGDKIQFVSRWCLATMCSFKYYTRFDSRIEGKRPLVEIKLGDIEAVHRANVNVQSYSKLNKDVGPY